MALELSCLDMELLLSFSTPVDTKDVPAASSAPVQTAQPLLATAKTNDSKSDVINESKDLLTSEIKNTLAESDHSSINNSNQEVIFLS